MSRFFLHLISTTLFVTAIILAGHSHAHSDSVAEKSARRPVYDSSYRSRTPRHKVIVQAADRALRESILAAGGSTIEDYGAFALMSAPDSAAERVEMQSAAGSLVRDDLNVVLLRAGAIDTTEVTSSLSVASSDSTENNLYLVQMIGPIRKEWVDQLESSVEIISYIPNNTYLVRGRSSELGRIKGFTSAGHNIVQWTGDFKPEYKLAPEIRLDSSDEITVTIQMLDRGQSSRDVEQTLSMTSATVVGVPESVLKYTNVHARVSASRLADLARLSNIVWIEPWAAPTLLDEKQDLIVSGRYTGNTLSPHGYLAWLQSKGLATTPDFLVDVSDSGIDQGSLDPQVLHRDFLNTAGGARVVYARFVGALDMDIIPEDTGGHGTINAAIVGGYNNNTSFPYADDGGYSLGVGVYPFARIGVTRIFTPDYTNPDLTTMVDMMYRDGSRISNNSWGAYNNAYTADCQLYDAMVRDARRGDAGNQEMTIVFSSGNKGAGGNLTTPGNAKNVITVGASENLRDGLDGCQINSDGADNINEIISFSSGGPSADGRVKPDIVAPGTHIQGARSQSRAYQGAGVCGPANYPTNQFLYTWSSGTSHSAPAVAGAAALVRQYFQQSIGRPPSPAMIKAFLTNSATYLTGFHAGDNLPGNNQGWGLLNIGRAFDNSPRIMIDETQTISNTGQTITQTGRVSDPTKPFRITLAWTDAPGTPAANASVNDLDLQVDIGGKTYLGNNFSADSSTEGGTADHKNNLESVWLPAGVSGDFTVRVVGANIAGDGVPGNSDLTDQDFALVIYNAQAQSSGGGGGGGSTDAPPNVKLNYPVGGEHLMVGNLLHILWDASDDKSIVSQRVEFAIDGVEFSTIADLDGRARSYDWHIPAVPTQSGRIRVTALDGVNLPVSSSSAGTFEIINGPPDLVPPTVTVQAPNSNTIVGGGLALTVKWRESDNVGVIQRVVELSTDSGSSWQQIASIVGPSSGSDQSFDWQIPIDLQTEKAKVRVRVYDGANNVAVAESRGSFDVWPQPIITDVTYNDGDKPELVLSGRFFRFGETDIYIDGKRMKKLRWDDKFYTGQNTYRRVSTVDKKVAQRVPLHQDVVIQLTFETTGQSSPEFVFRRKRL
jgi:subtilase family protein